MSKLNTEQPQGVFSFFDDVEKTDPPKPKRNPLRPPQQIEAEEAVEQQDIAEAHLEPHEPLPVQEAPVEENTEQPEKIVAIEETVEDIEEEPHIVEKSEEIRIVAEPETIPYTDENAVPDEEPVVKKGTRGRRSVKENSAAADLIGIPDDEELFKKQYYSMGEVTTMFNENHSLIRYWESEFDILKPKKNGKGDRFFRPVDVKNLYLIYDLLRRRKFTIEGAREYLKNSKKAEEKFTAVQSLEKIKSFFLELKASL